ncbi:VOC family protein [Streptomyces griseorubiginosus]|uniref:VOC family protein n=1 Tax=Streptomyces griseorubiginosus TaxID=67304 RepID=UPI000AE10188|nr:VOC family protein [Streptomyces griseorubiginosus]
MSDQTSAAAEPTSAASGRTSAASGRASGSSGRTSGASGRTRTAPEQTSAAPEGYTTVAPWVVTDDTGAFLDFVTEVFGGEELGRVATESGAVGHAEIRIGDTVVLAFDRSPDWPVMPSLLRVFVQDADATFARALKAGARVVTDLSDSAFGQRGGRIRDPFGTIWWVVAHVEDVPEEEMWRRLAMPEYAESMRVAQETFDAEMTGRGRGRSSAPVRKTSPSGV